MQSSRPCQTEEDNLEGARGGTVPGMFIESFARRRQRNEGGRGQWVEQRDKESGRDREQAEEKKFHEQGIDGWSGGMTGGE